MLDVNSWTDVLIRLGIATALGGLVGLERQIHHGAAGVRTYMIVSLGAAAFTATGAGLTPGDPAAVTRIIQGLAAGVGFLGAGTIFQLKTTLEVRGLNTASALWLSAAVGTACGVGMYAIAVVASLLSVIVLTIVSPLLRAMGMSATGHTEPPPSSNA